MDANTWQNPSLNPKNTRMSDFLTFSAANRSLLLFSLELFLSTWMSYNLSRSVSVNFKSLCAVHRLMELCTVDHDKILTIIVARSIRQPIRVINRWWTILLSDTVWENNCPILTAREEDHDAVIHRAISSTDLEEGSFYCFRRWGSLATFEQQAVQYYCCSMPAPGNPQSIPEFLTAITATKLQCVLQCCLRIKFTHNTTRINEFRLY